MPSQDALRWARLPFCSPAFWWAERSGARGRSDQGRLQHGADRRGRAERQAEPAGAGNLARRRQRQGRASGPPGRARLLRRPEQSQQRAGHLHQAHQRRQGRPAGRALCHQHDRAGDAGHHAEQQDDDRHARRSTSTASSTIRRYFSMVPGGDEGTLAFSRGWFELAAAQNPEAEDRRARRRRRRIRQDRLRRRARERQERRLRHRLRQELSAGHDRHGADHARHAGDQCRIWCLPAPIRPTRSASCAPRTKSA